MLTSRYMIGVKNVPAIMKQIISGSAPDKFTVDHLKGLGFKSSGDRGIIPVLKDMKFLSSDGTPTQRYHDYRDPSKSAKVLGEGLRDAYGDLFLINESLSASDRKAIEGKFKSTTNSTDRVAALQAMTFLAFLGLADVSGGSPNEAVKEVDELQEAPEAFERGGAPILRNIDLRYTIEVHLPPTKEIEVYNAIFKSLRQNLLDD
jgi:hypothetical protein